MKIRQLSIFLENRVGRLDGVVKILGEAGIDILAISVADTTDFGVLRLIVKDIEKADQILREQGVVCRINNVSVAAVKAAPGGLAEVLAILHAAGVNIEYMYAIAQTRRPQPLMVFRFTEGERAAAALQAAGVELLDEASLFADA